MSTTIEAAVPEASRRRLRFSSAQIAVLRRCYESGMAVNGEVFDACVAELNVDAVRVVNWVRREAAARRHHESMTSAPPTLPARFLPASTEEQQPRVVAVKGRSRKRTLRDVVQRQAAIEIRQEETLPGGPENLKKINERASVLLSTMSLDERAAAQGIADADNTRLENASPTSITSADRKFLKKRALRIIREQNKQLELIGISTMTIAYDEKTHSTDVCVSGPTMSKVYPEIENTLDHLITSSRQEVFVAKTVVTLRKQVKEYLLQELNKFENEKGRKQSAVLPSQQLSEKCPILLKDWPQEVSTKPTNMSKQECKDILSRDISFALCSGCVKCQAADNQDPDVPL